VEHPRNPLRINVGFLINQPIGTNRDISFEYSHIRLSHDLELSQFRGVANVGRTPQGLLLKGDFQGYMDMECVRCLADFQQNLRSRFDELFAFSRRSVSESELLLPEDGKIDLAPLVREYLVLEIPISPLCKPDCKGLCVVCGENLNEYTCEHQLGDKEDATPNTTLGGVLRKALSWDDT